ncbi:beta-galactosidase [Microbacterium sp. 179-I 3D2 NHS]|uniref:beta-galactosidase n=1 Tax=Microbacterium sp. 179-I 3D2 NHS TaxID=3235178 RepID=UPI0039A1D124
MTTVTTETAAAVTAVAAHARHTPWATAASRPPMSNEPQSAARVTVTNRFLERDGRPFIPVSGEMHYSRVPRSRWLDRLRLMRAGGLTAVATYVPWIHHEETRGDARFDGNRDIRAFVASAAEVGLDVVLRIGPWVHSEVRNGGFPDWVQAAEVVHRTNDPAYLALVEPWYARLAAELEGLVGEPGPVIAIQIENELYDQPDHIAALKDMARRVGLEAPIWTATGWGEAALPEGEVFPLYGGYPDGFWAKPDAGWPEAFREQFFFTHLWDDPHIGADLRWHFGGPQILSGRRSPSGVFPPATCELGGGMIGAYHRRPKVGGADVAAVGLAKIGSGSAWQGFYMYVGGVNPRGRTTFQESHASGYPNDMPAFDYDFHAPVSTTGRVRESHALLRRQHAFLAAFGEQLATMPSTLPAVKPPTLGDTQTLRWALRSDGRSGFVFVNAHQPYEPLDPPATRFELDLDHETIAFPDEAVRIPPGTMAHWPVNLAVDGITVRWATASALTLLAGTTTPTLVLIAEADVPVQVAFTEDVRIDAADARLDGRTVIIDAATSTTVGVRSGDRTLDLLVLSPEDAARVWVLEDPERRLVVADGALWVGPDGALAGRTTTPSPVRRYDTAARAFVDLDVALDNPATDRVITTELLRPEGAVPADGYGRFHEIWSAPDLEQRRALARRIRVPLPADIGETDAELEVSWHGDVLQLVVDGEVVYDQFWTGHDFVVNLADVGAAADSDVVLELLPLHPDAPVRVWEAGQALRDRSDTPIGRIDAVRVVEPARWRETAILNHDH